MAKRRAAVSLRADDVSQLRADLVTRNRFDGARIEFSYALRYFLPPGAFNFGINGAFKSINQESGEGRAFRRR